jgi:hypothetical protein
LNKKDKEVQLNEIIETYRTKFWIDEHQWFVRCHWYSSEQLPSSCTIMRGLHFPKSVLLWIR